MQRVPEGRKGALRGPEGVTFPASSSTTGPLLAVPAPAPSQNLATRASRGGLSLPGSPRDARDGSSSPATAADRAARALSQTPALRGQCLRAQGELQLEAGVGIVQLLTEELA